MAVNVLPVHITGLMTIEFKIGAALHGRTVLNVPTLLAVIDCGKARTSDLEKFMCASFEVLIREHSLETQGGGELAIMGVCQPADADGVVDSYWRKDIPGPKPQQVFVVLFGNDNQACRTFLDCYSSSGARTSIDTLVSAMADQIQPK